METPSRPEILLDEGPVVPEGHLSRHELARLETGELGEEALARVEAHLVSCERCAGRLDAIRADAAAFLADRPPARFEAALAARRRPGPWARLVGLLRGPRPLGFGLAAVAAVALAIFVWPATTGGPPRTPPGGTRLKAAVGLDFFAEVDGVVTPGRPGGSYRPGDRIQLRYSTPQQAHLVVVSLDSRGAVTAFYDDVGRSLPVDAGVARVLDGSVILDDALGPERVVGCFSTEPVPTERVLAAARRALAAAGGDPLAAGPLDLPCVQAAFVIHKQPRPE